jgi:hypothetical protein
MRSHITRALYAGAAASLVVTALGLTGPSPAGAATAAAGSMQTGYNGAWSGYGASGRWFRFVSTTLTVPARTLPEASSGDAIIQLQWGHQNGLPAAMLMVHPGGGPGSIEVSAHPGGNATLRLAPQVGDQLTVSIYYDRNGHDYFTATDLTQNTTQTVQMSVPKVVYDTAFLGGVAVGTVDPPQADTRLWKFADSRLTTYTGQHGTVVGPWATKQVIATTTGTSAGTVKLSPSGLSSGGANFGVWLRALPLDYTTGFAGYGTGGGPFRFIATTMTVPAPLTTGSTSSPVLMTVGHTGGPTPRPYAYIEVTPGGGAGSISYTCNAAAGTFTVSPQPGDQLAVSIYYDQNGHYSYTVTDTTQGTTQTITTKALYADSMVLNYTGLYWMPDNSTITPPPSDVQLWTFNGSRVTSYTGDHGTILGPWTTQWRIDTTDGTSTGAVVADASVLSNGGQDFSVWLRHH